MKARYSETSKKSTLDHVMNYTCHILFPQILEYLDVILLSCQAFVFSILDL